MKKLIFSFILLLSTGLIFAQVSFGPKVGFNMSKYGYQYSDDLEYLEPNSNFKLGGTIGGMMNLQIVDFLAFQPSLMIAKKGTGLDVADLYSGEAVVEGYYRVRVTYLEVPLNLALGLKLGTFRFQVFAGPYLAYAIAGKHKWDYELNEAGIRTDVKGEEKINFTSEISEENQEKERYQQRPFDMGVNFGVGYKVNKVLLNLGFAMGLTNLRPEMKVDGNANAAKDLKYANRTIFLSAAWLFGED
ncbi:MAG TPA: porin family protein [Bacteroidales bacterium]|nr:porin family protein [Bacteroidales bacterium]